MIIAALALALSANRHPPTLTYETVAKPVFKVLADLSKITGVKLTAVGPPAAEPLILSLREASVKETLAKLAEVVLGRWKVSGDGYVLESDPAKVREAEDADFRQRLSSTKAFLRGAMTKLAKQSFEPAVLDRQIESLSKVVEQNGEVDEDKESARPIYRLGVRLLCSLNPEALARAPVGSRLVFSTEATRVESSFGDASQKAIQDFIRERQAWKDSQLRVGVQDNYSEDSVVGKDPTPVFVAVTVRTNEDYQSATVQAVFKDSSTDEATVFVLETDSHSTGKAAVRSPKAQALVFSDSVRAIKEADKKHSLPPEVREMVLNPAKYDPLSFEISEALLQVAKNENKSLVANVGDDLAYDSLDLGEAGKWSGSFLAALQNESDVTVSSDLAWISVQAARPARAQQRRTDRVALTGLLKELEPDRLGYTERLADFAYEHRESTDSWFMAGLFHLLYRGWIHWYGEELAFYGSLSPRQLAYLRGGNRLAYNDLTQDQRLMAMRTDPADSLVSSYNADVISSTGEMSGRRIRTDSFGVPFDLTISFSETVGWVAADIVNDEPEVKITAGTYDEFLRQPGKSEVLSKQQKGRKFTPLQQRELQVAVCYGASECYTPLMEFAGRQQKPVPIQSFPQGFFDEVAAVREANRLRRPVIGNKGEC